MPSQKLNSRNWIHFLWVFWFISMCMFAVLCTWWGCVYASNGQRSTLVVVTWEMSILFIETMFPTGPERATKARQPQRGSQPQGATCLQLSGLGLDVQVSKLVFFFFECRFWGPNSDPCSCTANTTYWTISLVPFPWLWSFLTRRWLLLHLTRNAFLMVLPSGKVKQVDETGNSWVLITHSRTNTNL